MEVGKVIMLIIMSALGIAAFCAVIYILFTTVKNGVKEIKDRAKEKKDRPNRNILDSICDSPQLLFVLCMLCSPIILPLGAILGLFSSIQHLIARAKDYIAKHPEKFKKRSVEKAVIDNDMYVPKSNSPIFKGVSTIYRLKIMKKFLLGIVGIVLVYLLGLACNIGACILTTWIGGLTDTIYPVVVYIGYAVGVLPIVIGLFTSLSSLILMPSILSGKVGRMLSALVLLWQLANCIFMQIGLTPRYTIVMVLVILKMLVIYGSMIYLMFTTEEK